MNARPLRAAGLALVAALAIAVAVSSVAGGSTPRSAPAAKPKPNFVFVLTDDLSLNLLRYLPQVQKMKAQGTSFSRYFVTDSLCCPSRSTIFAGRYPHSTHVINNTPPFGGFGVFHGKGQENDTYATSMNKAGYDTAMMGKYLNGYKPRGKVNGAAKYVPPGWDVWSVAGNGYPEFNYNFLNKDYGRAPTVIHHGNTPADYLTDAMSQRAQTFIRQARDRKHPFMLELASFAPHQPATPAPRDANRFPGLKAPRNALFNRGQVKRGRPRWLSAKPLTAAEMATEDTLFRKRAQSLQAVDKMIADIRAQLARLGAAKNTYIVFSSDNGFHLGERRLVLGKQTAWDHDIHVPLVVVGPGVRAGKSVSRLAQNTDLRPTFQRLAGLKVSNSVEGRSLVSLLKGDRVKRWRRVTLVEHRGPGVQPGDPDKQTKRQGNPPSYQALRFGNALYVRYERFKAFKPEYYNLKKDPLERRNVYYKLSKRKKAQLRRQLKRFHACKSGRSCRKADRG
jgi:N-acetylglucosamine-6-sulfatase